MTYYKVIVDISNSEVDKVFYYHSDSEIEVGSRVSVPFGPRTIEGFVIGTADSSPRETKAIISVLDDFTAVTPEMLELAEFLKTKNIRYADALRLFIPSKLRGSRIKAQIKNVVRVADCSDFQTAYDGLPKTAKAQRAVLDYLKENGEEYQSVLNSEFSPSAVKKLAELNIITILPVEVQRIPDGLKIERKHITLTDEQASAVKEITEGKDIFYLLHGVTGSGKTEIYMNVIEKCLAVGKTAVMLVPEISLTPQMLGVFRARFGEKVSLLHSGLSDGERFDEWRRLRSGSARVALGARSAIFAPVQNVGVIIIDEEHDSSYVSESNPRYFTSDIAKFRAIYNGAKLVMGSATPSIDSYYLAKKGEYKLITLKNRANNLSLPEIETVDMRAELRSGNTSLFSRALLKALDETLSAGNQAMVFINRRGYVSFVRCRSCGYVPKCTDCDVSLTYHKEDNALKCHYCGKQFRMIDKCPICGFEDLKEGKIGTEKVTDELQRIFPKASILRMDNDTTSTKNAFLSILSSFAEGKADILVGTQMIAKGHDFKNVTLVGILDADLALNFSDYRSNERTFQLITQVAGRAGREKKAGKVIMQTYSPKHYVYRYATRYDYEGFYEKEANARETTKFPPFSVIARIMVLSQDDGKAIVATRTLYQSLNAYKSESNGGIIRVQATRAPIKKIQTHFRYQVVVWVDVKREASVMPMIYAEADKIISKDITSFVEINPQQML